MTVTGDETVWKRVGQQVRDRRIELGLTIEDGLERAYPKVSRSVWSNLERGVQEGFQPLSLAAISRALQWTSDSIENMVAGHDPQVVPGDEPLMASTEVRRELGEIRQDLNELTNLVHELLREVRAQGSVEP